MRLESLERRCLLSVGPLVISEFMASNTKTIQDQDGAYSDWIEVYNPGASMVNLSGWSLTDSASSLKMWQFPSQTLAAGQYQLVFASGKNRAVAGSELHTNFQLAASGGYLGLVEPDGKTISDAYSPSYPAQVSDVSYGWSQDLSTQGYFTSPTPGRANVGQPIPNASQQVIVNEMMYHPGFGDPGYPGYIAEDTLKQWVELYNKGTSTVDLSGWQLDQGVHFTIPTGTTLAAGGYLVVAADPATFHATYPSVTNYIGGTTLVAAGASAKALVPTNANLNSTWTQTAFNDSGWTSGTTGVGYEKGTGYGTLIGLNVATAMYGNNTSVYTRVPFSVSNPASLTTLHLRMKYDDGFVAYLNGVQVASRNAPASPTWNSAATGEHLDDQAVMYEDIDISASLSALVTGTNVLAIQAMDVGKSDSHMLVSPELVANCWSGKLGAGGDTVTLDNALGQVVNSVSYTNDGDWAQRRLDAGYGAGGTQPTSQPTWWKGWEYTTGADAGGKSLELIDPNLPNQYGENWQASVPNGGTPGAANSVTAANTAPLIENVTHFPVVPTSIQTVTITATLIDELLSGVTATLYYRTDSAQYATSVAFNSTTGRATVTLANHGYANGASVTISGADQGAYDGTFTVSNVTTNTFDISVSGSPVTPATGQILVGKPFNAVPMYDDGQHGDGIAGDGVFGGVLPAQADHTVVEFYVQSRDAGGNNRTWPAPTDSFGGQGANALYQVDNTPAVNHSDQPLYLIITTAAQWNVWTNLVNSTTNGAYNGAYSDSQMNATWISIDGTGTEVHYGCGVRNRGSGTRVRSPHNFHVNFPSDNLWEHYSQVELNTQYTESQTVGNSLFSMAGLYNTYGTPVQVNVNGANLAGTGSPQFGSYYRFLSYSSEWTSTHAPYDSNGDMYWGTHADDNIGLTTGADLSNQGANAANYQQVYAASGPVSNAAAYQKKTNSNQNDWSDLVNLVTALNATYASDDAYYQAVSKLVNIDEWVKFFAVNSLLANGENGLSNGTPDDFYLFRGMLDSRFQLINHDMDTVLGEGDTAGDSMMPLFAAADGWPGHSSGVAVLNTFLRNSEITPKYYAALQQYATTVFSAVQLNPLIDHLLGSWVPAATIQNMKTFAASRVAWVLSQISTSLTAASPETVLSGYPHTFNATTSLTGKFNVLTTASIKVNSVALPVSDLKTAPAAPYMRPWAGDWAVANIALNPGINRIVIQAFDASGSEIDRTTIDVWRDRGAVTTVAGGTLAASTTWTAASGPYSVTGSLTIPSGMTLTIQPGTSVYMGSGANLTVNDGGTLLAQGTDTQRIVISAVPGGSAWGGIVVNGSFGSPQTTISYANIVNNGTTAIHSAGGTVFLDHLTFGTNLYQYFSLDSSSFIVQDCEFPAPGAAFEPGHGTGGIKTDGRGLFLRNFFGATNNYNDVVDFTGGNRPSGPIVYFVDNVIMGMSDDGWDLDGTDAWIQGNIFLHAHKNGNTPDTSSGVSSGGDSGNTSEITIIDNIFYDVDQAAQVKDGGFFTLLNNTIVHQSHVGGIDTTGAVVCAADNGVQSLGIYLEGNIVSDAENLVRNQTTSQVTFNNNLMSLTWSGAGSGNALGDPRFNHVPQLAETNFTNWKQAQVMRQWLGLSSGSPAIGTGINGADKGGVNLTGASISGEPVGTTPLNTATLTVGVNRTGSGIPTTAGFPNGSGYVDYKWRLDDGAWSAETPIGTPITLTGLANGTHHVDVIGKTDSGLYQNDAMFGSDALITASRTWTVNTALAPHVRINEILADNVAAVPYGSAPNVSYPDMAELYNDGQGTMDLSGMSLSDNPASPRLFVFPAGTTLAQGQYMVLYGGTDTGSPTNHLGFAFGSNGDSLYLYNSPANGGGVVDSVTFGMQLPDRSIGRLADGSWGLTTPTFGTANLAVATAKPSKMKINEWLASENVVSANDFIELYNGDTLPVNMGGMYLTDNPEDLPEEVYLNQQNPTTVAAPLAIPALSFIAGSPIVNGLATGGYAVFKADSTPSQGANHLAFKLRPFEGLIGLFDSSLNKIDQVLYGPQTTDVSEGRNPLGDSTYSTETIPTPGIENTGTTSGSTANSTTTPIFDMTTANGLTNQVWKYLDTGTNMDGTGWYGAGYNDAGWASSAGVLNYYNANSGTPLHSESFPGYTVNKVLAAQTTSPNYYPWPVYYFRTTFTFYGDPTQVTSVSGNDLLDDGAVVYLNGTDVAHLNMPSGAITNATFAVNNISGTAPVTSYSIPLASFPGLLKQGTNVLAVEVHQQNSGSSDITWACSLNVLSGGQTQVIRQVALPANITNLANNLRVTEVMYNPAGDADLEFIELQNTGSTTLDLTGVRIGGGVTFTFPSMQLAAGQYVVAARNATKFTAFYGPGINLAGQYTGKLNNSGDDIVLQLPAPYDTDILRFSYVNTWVPASNGQGYSMIVRDAHAAAAGWNTALNWQAGATLNGTPGRAEGLSDVVINEVLTHTDQPLFDSIELYNHSTTNTVDISGWYLTDDGSMLKYRIPNNTVLTPGQYKVFDAHDFAIADYAGVNDGVFAVEDAGATLHLTGNGWKQVSLRDPLTYAAYHVTANTTLEFDYKGSLPDALQGIGLDSDDTSDSSHAFKLAGGDSWGISVTPASMTADGWSHYVINVGTTAPALLNSYMTRLFFANKDSTGDAQAYYRNVKVYEAPSGTPRIFDFSKYFGFNAHQGDDVWLIQADSTGSAIRFDDHVSFGAAINGESFGRWPNGTGNLAPMHLRTLGSTNGVQGNGPRVGPLVISEVMYNPDRNRTDVDNFKYIEIYNPTGVNVSMANWQVQQGVTFNFAASTVIGPYQTMLVVPFDPANSTLLSAFQAYYGLGTSANIAGPYFGQLSNVGAEIQLTRPDALQPGSPSFYPQLLEDEVIYQNSWGGAGDGQSLQRSEITGWGDDPASWTHAVPTPGSAAANPHVATWTGGAGKWSDTTWNGSLSTYPDYRSDVVVNTAHIITVDSSDQGNSLTVSNGGQVSIPAGNSLTISDDITVGVSGAASTLQLAQGGSLVVGGLLTIGLAGTVVLPSNLGAAQIGGLLVQGGTLSGGTLSTGNFVVQAGTIGTNLSGTGTLTKQTTGTAVLSGVNTYIGGTAVLAGKLVVSNATALPDGSALSVGADSISIFGGTSLPSQSLLTATAQGQVAPAPTAANISTLANQGSLMASGTSLAAPMIQLSAVANAPAAITGSSVSTSPAPSRLGAMRGGDLSSTTSLQRIESGAATAAVVPAWRAVAAYLSQLKQKSSPSDARTTATDAYMLMYMKRVAE